MFFSLLIVFLHYWQTVDRLTKNIRAVNLESQIFIWNARFRDPAPIARRAALTAAKASAKLRPA